MLEHERHRRAIQGCHLALARGVTVSRSVLQPESWRLGRPIVGESVRGSLLVHRVGGSDGVHRTRRTSDEMNEASSSVITNLIGSVHAGSGRIPVPSVPPIATR